MKHATKTTKKASKKNTRARPATTEANPIDASAYAIEVRIDEARAKIGVLCALFAANDGDTGGLAKACLNPELASQVRRYRREDFNTADADVLFQLRLAHRGLDMLARNAGGQGCTWSGAVPS